MTVFLLILMIMHISLIDSVVLSFKIVPGIFASKLGLLEEAIVLRLKSHYLRLLSGHAVNSVDQSREVLFLAMTLVNLIMGGLPSHLLQFESCLVPHTIVLRRLVILVLIHRMRLIFRRGLVV